MELRKNASGSGGPPTVGKLQSREYNEINEDLQALVRGQSQVTSCETECPVHAAAYAPSEVQLVNVLLQDSPRKRSPEVFTLGEKLIAEVAEMNPEAIASAPQRPMTTCSSSAIDDICQRSSRRVLPNGAAIASVDFCTFSALGAVDGFRCLKPLVFPYRFASAQGRMS